jgi:hypothetical protein
MKTNRKQLQVILAGAFLAAGGIAALLGYTKYAFPVGSVNVAIYPAAFLALVGVVQIWRAFFVNTAKS